MRIWLDDLREAPEGWIWVRSVAAAKDVLLAAAMGITDPVEYASLDNDLGEGECEGRRLLLWMTEHEIWPTKGVEIHSANPVAHEYMRGMVERYGPY